MKLWLVENPSVFPDTLDYILGSGSDFEMTFDSVSIAELIAEKTITYKYDVIYCSKLNRSSATASLIHKHNFFRRSVNIEEKEELNDRNYGIVEQSRKSVLYKNYKKSLVDSWFEKIQSSPPNGESIFQVLKRVELFYENHILNSKLDTVIVSDKIIIQCLITLIEELNINTIPQNETRLGSVIEYEF